MANQTWSQVKDVLRDVAVDKALEDAQTSFLYQKMYEEQKKKWETTEIKRGLRVDIEDESSKHTSQVDKEKARDSDRDSMDELEKELENDPELRKIEELREQFNQQQKNYPKVLDIMIKWMKKICLKWHLIIDLW